MVAITNSEITYKYYFKKRAARKKLFCTIFEGIVSKYLLKLYLLPPFTIKASVKGSSKKNFSDKWSLSSTFKSG
jgi:hypothetical protein